MSWNPKKDLQPVTRFRNNLIEYMRINMPAALAWAAGQCGLASIPPVPDSDSYFTSLAVRLKRPAVNVLTQGADPEDDDDDNRLETKRLTVEVERTAADSDQLIESLEAYTLAFTSMILEMSEEDWCAGMPADVGGDLDVTVGRERYSGRTYETEKTFLQVGSVEVTITYTQT